MVKINMIYYPRYAPYWIRCPQCGGRLEIWAFTWAQGDTIDAEPVLVCDRTCGTFWSMSEIGTNENDLCCSKEQYKKEVRRAEKYA